MKKSEMVSRIKKYFYNNSIHMCDTTIKEFIVFLEGQGMLPPKTKIDTIIKGASVAGMHVSYDYDTFKNVWDKE